MVTVLMVCCVVVVGLSIVVVVGVLFIHLIHYLILRSLMIRSGLVVIVAVGLMVGLWLLLLLLMM